MLHKQWCVCVPAFCSKEFMDMKLKFYERLKILERYVHKYM